ncbi:MAG: hypothetical protein COA78_12940 [Blastopirellula sp.]|nr:MAG: hypothetical protein COA78_12940 [Blastopirellula sp.]
MKVRRRSSQQPISLFAFQDIITAVTGIFILIMLILAIQIVDTQHQTSEPAEIVASDRDLEILEELTLSVVEITSEIDRLNEMTALAAGSTPDQLSEDIKNLREAVVQLKTERDAKDQQVLKLNNQVQSLQNELKGSQLQTRTEQLKQKLKDIESKRSKLKATNRIVYNLQNLAGKQAWLVDISDEGILAAPFGEVTAPLKFPSRTSSAFREWLDSQSDRNCHIVLFIRPNVIDQFLPIKKMITQHGISVGFDLIGEADTVIDPVSGASS